MTVPVHMAPIPVEEAVAAIEAAAVIERKVVDPDTEETTLAEMTVEEAVTLAEASVSRCWVKRSRTRYELRMELADEVVMLPSVTPPPA